MQQKSKTLTIAVSCFKKYKAQPLQTTWEIVEYDDKNHETDNFQTPFKFISPRSRSINNDQSLKYRLGI